MKPTSLLPRLLCLLVAVAPAAANADVISDWNNAAVHAGVKHKTPNFLLARAIATMHAAAFDAVNAIEPRYSPYRVRMTAPRSASKEAAAAAAAHTVLVRMLPALGAELDSTYQKSLAGVPAGDARAEGIRLGEAVAAELVALRSQDGTDGPNTYRPLTTPGAYVPTPLPLGASWTRVTPFVLETPSQFRPPAPYPLYGAQWAQDYEEIKAVGAKKSATRTAAQTETARFWEFTGPGTYNPILQQLAAHKKLELVDSARLFALFAMAAADNTIATFDAKYAHAFWRPVTAIRNGDRDGNAATERDAAWETLVPTPPHPEYPCLHCSSSNAIAAVLRTQYGDAIGEFSLTSPTAPGVTRRFDTLSAYLADVSSARIYGGVHYRASTVAGSELGRKVGEYVARNALKPLHGEVAQAAAAH